MAKPTRHRCFGQRLLSKAQYKTLELKQSSEPTHSCVFFPLHMRTDCFAAMRVILSSRYLADTDETMPALMLLAMLRRSCMGCLLAFSEHPTHQEELPPQALLHVCRSYVEELMREKGALVCHLFNVAPDEHTLHRLRQWLIKRTFH